MVYCLGFREREIVDLRKGLKAESHNAIGNQANCDKPADVVNHQSRLV
jgi:hypothetical protein